jgi:DHA2 family multidrug resistance protein-like MFS transporter
MLIAARAALGIAGATLAPSSLALIRNLFADPDQRKTAIAIWLSCFAAGAAIGPVIGGALLQQFWWGSVFLMNVPVMALLLVLAPALLPESRDPNPGRLDLISAAISLVAVLGVIYGITRTAEHGADLLAALAVLVGVLGGYVFLRRQRRLAYPLVDIGLFRSAMFVAAFAALLASVFVVSGSDLFVAQYLQLVRGIGPFVTGLWLVPEVIALIVGAMLAPALSRLIRPGLVVAGALGLAAIGLVVLAQLEPDSSLAVLVTGTALVGLGAGPVGTLGTDIVVAAAPAERAGAASALSETATEFGGALGIAVLGSVGTAIYRNVIGDGLPSRVPSHATDAAHDTLGAAVTAAAHLPAQLAGEVLDLARVAFTDGLEVAVLVGAGVGAAIALLAALELRSARLETE